MSKAMKAIAAYSRPGSLEARVLDGCTCSPETVEERQGRTWDPRFAADWVDVLSLDCPAHGGLAQIAMSARVKRLIRTERVSAVRRITPAERLEAARAEAHRKRSLFAKLREALGRARMWWGP